ncbi:GNAT family N-acetyltransferase [Cellulophaga tyrosinoxydans]|uniref:Protein N-acetyltransferase, RimJ/RimL family n=1 Tax=Cellulophaga tyrosinoxydans TaxID=504486 RepID=A0A1W2CEF2_9FLAO|nr:GNAT family N-acetyltransferase [Cellulophaga tyrosinoxydans]SMC83657.1 Protein N-acetyltransferase, RimJ/RimL family [Cellulophaga tyrosinoxydans]
MKILDTTRLTLREFILTDTNFILDLVNAPNWLKFIGNRGIKTNKEAEEYLLTGPLKSYATHGYGLWLVALKNTNIPIGMCGFLKRDYLKNPDIGFAILPDYEGLGYTYEAAIAAIHYGKNNLKLNPILGITTEDNYKSRNLLEKIGLSEVDTIKLEPDQKELLVFSTEVAE